MRLAVLADIHSNATALAALRRQLDSEGWTACASWATWSGLLPAPPGAGPAGRLVGPYPCWVLAGNRERYLLWPARLGVRPGGRAARAALRYTYQALRPADWAYLEGLPTSLRLSYPAAPPSAWCTVRPGTTGST